MLESSVAVDQHANGEPLAPMKLCVISSKECWQDESGVWFTSGGFPLQMAGLGALFEEMTVVIVRVQPRPGGVPLPPSAKIVSMPRPPQGIARRRAWLVKGLPEYLRLMIAPVRQADVVHTHYPAICHWSACSWP